MSRKKFWISVNAHSKDILIKSQAIVLNVTGVEFLGVFVVTFNWMCSAFKTFCLIHTKTPVLGSFFNAVAGLRS